MNEQTDATTAPSISLREYGDILRRRRAIILQATLFVLIVGIIWTSFQPNVYRATARLLIEPQTSSINLNNNSDPLDGLFKLNENYNIGTQVELLQAPDIIKSVQDKVHKQLPLFNIQAVPDTQIIEVQAESADQNLAADATNTLLETYEDNLTKHHTDQMEKAIAFAKEKATGLGKQVNDYDQKIAATKRLYNVVELGESLKAAEASFDSSNNRKTQIDSELAANQTRINAVQTQLRNLSPTQSNVLSPEGDVTFNSLQQKLDDARTQRAVMSKNLQPQNDRMLEIDAQIAELTKRVNDARNSFFKRNAQKNPEYVGLQNQLLSLSADSQVLGNQLLAAERSVATAKKRIAELPKWQEAYMSLMRARDGAQAQIGQYDAEQTQLTIRMQAQPKLVSIVSRAQVPETPIRPNRVQNIIFAALIGLFLGFGLALLQELFDDRINSADDAERTLKLPSLGHIPMIEEEGLRLIRDISTFSPLMESYRTLRTNINFAAVGNTVRSMVVTSSVPAEGKSTTCANLAMAMAMDGKKVIIVDADLRRPSLHHLFKVDASPGLTDILIGSHTIDAVMRPTNIENVTIIPAGSPPPNPAELLGSAAMGRFLAEIETRADIVLLDTPPTLAVADAVVLAARTDGALLVVGYGDTKKASVKRAKDMLARGNANVLGTVLNRMDGAGGGYYYYGKYYSAGGYAPYAPGAGGAKRGGYAPVSGGNSGSGTKRRSSVGPYAPNRSDRTRIEGTDGGNTAVVEPEDTTGA